MRITKEHFDRACKEFRIHAQDKITVSFKYGAFFVSSSSFGIDSLLAIYKNREAAFIHNGYFVLRTSFSGFYDSTSL